MIDRYYSAYLAFFDEIVQKSISDPGSLMEEYIFSKNANFGTTVQGQHPDGVTRHKCFRLKSVMVTPVSACFILDTLSGHKHPNTVT